MKLVFIHQNKDGNYYIGYKIPVQRGIKGKNKSVVEELIIVGMHRSKLKDFLKKHNIKHVFMEVRK